MKDAWAAVVVSFRGIAAHPSGGDIVFLLSAALFFSALPLAIIEGSLKAGRSIQIPLFG